MYSVPGTACDESKPATGARCAMRSPADRSTAQPQASLRQAAIAARLPGQDLEQWREEPSSDARFQFEYWIESSHLRIMPA